MKTHKFFLFVFVFFSQTIFAQAPNAFSYQAVVRNSSNNLVVNGQVGVRFSIYFTNIFNVYSESQAVTTNNNGLFTAQIGTGNVITGSIADIDWSTQTFFLKTEIDPTGGTNYSMTSITQILAAPYALYAKKLEKLMQLVILHMGELYFGWTKPETMVWLLQEKMLVKKHGLTKIQHHI